MLAGKHIVVCVTGGIAAFKSVELVRELGRRGAEVRVVMTESATRFVGPITFTGLTGKPPVTDLWDPGYRGEVHVELATWADAIVVAPATMHVIARAALGLGDDATLATLACAKGPVLFAPAMHTRMWERPSTARHVAQLSADGARFVGPVSGPLASGEVGQGRMAEPAAIVDAIEGLFSPRDFAGVRVMVTAGPTLEDLDPVRFIGNRSTGKMGYAIAAQARARGAEVVLISGPVELAPPSGVEVVHTRSAVDMRREVMARADDVDLIVMTAAVADYRAASVADHKLKKSGERLTLELVQNPDILAELGAQRTGGRPVLVGFAVETHDTLDYARGKLLSKKCDLVVANEARHGFGGDSNIATLVTPSGATSLGALTKTALADVILDHARERVKAP